MPVEHIVTIVLACLSTIGSLCAVIYVNVKSSFRDKQDSSIIIDNECILGTDEVTAKEKVKKINSKISIILNNVEHSRTQNLVLQNSNLDANKKIKIGEDNKNEESILIENNLNEETPLRGDNKGTKNIEITLGNASKTGDFPLSLYTNSLSDRQINESREKISIKALEVFNEIIKANVRMYSSIKEHDESSDNNLPKEKDLLGEDSYV